MVSKNVLISVIVPIYKVEDYLPRCINSILSQSFTDFELILVDDGSPDDCGKICDEYAEKDSRVRVFHKPNGGVSSARNLGLDKAQGGWITFIDSDDYVGINYLSDFVNVVQMCDTEFVVINNHCNIIGQQKEKILMRDEYEILFSEDCFHRVCAPWGKLFNLDKIRTLNLRFNQELSLGEDVIFVLSYLLGISKLVQIKSSSYYYELRDGSLTKKENSYEYESTTSEKFSLLVNPIIDTLNLGARSVCNLRIWQVLFTERVINSIMRLKTRRERLEKISKLDLSVYKQYKQAVSWKEEIVVFLLKNQYYRLFELLMSNR